MARPISETHTAFSVKPVTPHASNDLPDGPCRCLWVNDTGVAAVSVVAVDDTVAQVHKVTGPGPVFVSAKAVRVSGTTALDILAYY